MSDFTPSYPVKKGEDGVADTKDDWKVGVEEINWSCCEKQVIKRWDSIEGMKKEVKDPVSGVEKKMMFNNITMHS